MRPCAMPSSLLVCCWGTHPGAGEFNAQFAQYKAGIPKWEGGDEQGGGVEGVVFVHGGGVM